AEQSHLSRHPFPAEAIELFEPGDTFKVSNLEIVTGRSRHVVGGVWFAIGDEKQRVVYCGDVVPESTVFLMDPIPSCELLVLVASYGADAVSGAERAAAIARWIAAHPQGCLLPTPR